MRLRPILLAPRRCIWRRKCTLSWAIPTRRPLTPTARFGKVRSISWRMKHIWRWELRRSLRHRYEEAASFYARAVQSSPKTGTYYLLHAMALALAGRLEEARSWSSADLSSSRNFAFAGFEDSLREARGQVCGSGPLAGASGIVLIKFCSRRPYIAGARCRMVSKGIDVGDADGRKSGGSGAFRFGSTWPVRRAVNERPVFAQSRT